MKSSRKLFPRFQNVLIWPLLALAIASTEAETFYYSYDGPKAGLGIFEVDDATGATIRHDGLAEDLGLSSPGKLAVSDDGGNVVITSDQSPKVTILQVKPEVRQLASLDVDEATNDVRAWKDSALIAAEHGAFYQLDLKTGQVSKTWSSRQGLNPSGNKGEDILVLPEKGLALVTFQKDSSKGKHLGSRVVVLDLASMSAKHDLQLPRNRTDLHLDGSKKEQGPNPEVVIAAPKSDTMILTLDLYGAIGFARLSSALQGRLDKLDYVSSALDGSWGTSFPDRASLFEVGGKEYLMVSNASVDGGLTLFDVAARKKLQGFPEAAGCETPVLLSNSNKLVTAESGKIKTRDTAKVEKGSTPGNNLLVFDLAPLAQGKGATLERIPFDKPVVRVAAINPGDNDLLLLVLGDSESEMVIYDLGNRRIVHREAAKGKVSRIVAWSEQPASPGVASSHP